MLRSNFRLLSLMANTFGFVRSYQCILLRLVLRFVESLLLDFFEESFEAEKRVVGATFTTTGALLLLWLDFWLDLWLVLL